MAIKNQPNVPVPITHGAARIFLLHVRRNGANRIDGLRGEFDAMNEKKEISTTENATAPYDTGQDLKAIRETRGLSLDDIFQATRVSMITLQALENEDFKALPPPVYARNFIRKYARAVGIDEKPFLKRYERYLEDQNPPREDRGVQRPWPEASRRYRFLFGSLAIVIVAGIVVYALILYDQSERKKPPGQPIGSSLAEQVKPEPAMPTSPVNMEKPTVVDSTQVRGSANVSPPAQTSAATTPTASPGSIPVTGKPATPPAITASGGKITLFIEARELSWLRITEGRNPSFQVLLKPGEKIERTASDFFLLDVGNAAGVNLIFQGKPLGSLGKHGQVIHLRLPEQTTEKESP
jgi:cytoskeleton protein RodZ